MLCSSFVRFFFAGADFVGILRRNTFMDASATHRSRQSQSQFRAHLIAHYDAACPAHPDQLRCLVTSAFVRADLCIAAHILPHGSRRLLELYHIPDMDSINDVQNGILWAARIEQAYTANQVCMIYNPFTSELLFVVLDNGLMEEELGVKNAELVEMTFADVHCRPLEIAPEKMPSLRLLLNQAIYAMDHSSARGWPRPANFANIQRLLDAMRDVVSRMIVDREEDSSEFLERWAAENPDA